MASPLTNNFAALPIGAKIFINVLIIALLSMAYYLGIHMGLTDDIDQAQRKNAQLAQELKDAQARQRQYLALREELAKREKMDRQNLRILPEDAEIPAFLADLNRVAELSGLRMRRVQPRPEVADEFYTKVPVSLAISGEYHQLSKFFYNVSRLERAISMEDIRLTRPQEAGDGILLDVDVLATTYRRPEPGAGQDEKKGS